MKAVILAATLISAPAMALANDAVRDASTSATWCYRLGGDCVPHGLSVDAAAVYAYLTAENVRDLPLRQRIRAVDNIDTTVRYAKRGGVNSCRDLRTFVQAARYAPDRFVRRQGHDIDLIVQESCR